NPPPPELKDKVVQRADDTEETIRVRLTKYHENCGAVVDAFAGSAQILNVNGLEGKEKIASDIFQAVNSITNPLRALPPKLIICGPPAGGKGTQCEKLVQQYGVVHLSTGDMLRSAIAANTETGLKAKAFMDRGELVPDELILDTIIDRLNQPDCTAKGWLLDGFPRNESQARSMVNFGIIPDMVLVLEVSDEEVIKRISGRRVDISTGKTYHITFNPPPSDVKAIQRSDDNESTVKIRLKTYHLNVSAVLKVFSPLANVSYFHQSSSTEITKAMFRAIDVSRAKIDVEGNAFIMTLFCMEMPYQTCASSFLRYAFSLYQHKEYCLITLPPTARPPTFVSNFTFIPARPTSTYSHVLYLLHRDALTFIDPSPTDIIRVTRFRMTEQCDQLGALVEYLPPSSIADLENEMALAGEEDDIDIEDNPKHIIFVARLHGVVIAVASLTRDHEVTSNLKHHFDVEQYVVLTHHRAKDQAILSHFLLNPVYTIAGQFILKEVMRYFRKTCIFVSVPYHGHVSALVQETFILAPHRRQVVMKDVPKDEQPSAVERLTSNALYFFTKRLFSEPKCIVSSEMGLKAQSFMEAGELVPDELIVQVILERLQQPDCITKGWLLDGFPRTKSQAQAMLAQGIFAHLVIVLDVPDEEVVTRISGRRIDIDTGKTYHLTFNPPPPE
ncbi:adenylate kinase, partial [Thraustotheca clavata]